MRLSWLLSGHCSRKRKKILKSENGSRLSGPSRLLGALLLAKEAGEGAFGLKLELPYYFLLKSSIVRLRHSCGSTDIMNLQMTLLMRVTFIEYRELSKYLK